MPADGGAGAAPSYAEAQQKLGRTIGYDGQSTLLMIHDQYGLPVEVILMILEYAASQGKTSMAYIAKMGRDWGEREIDTLEKAEEQLTRLRTGQSLWNQLKALTGIHTRAQPPHRKNSSQNGATTSILALI